MALYRCGNVNSGDAKLEETTLWSNSYPGQQYSQNTESLSSSIADFDYIGIYYKPDYQYPTEILSITPVAQWKIMSEGSQFNVMLGSYYSGYLARAAWYVTNTSIKFSYCTKVGASGTNNYGCIPTKVVGMKVTI